MHLAAHVVVEMMIPEDAQVMKTTETTEGAEMMDTDPKDQDVAVVVILTLIEKIDSDATGREIVTGLDHDTMMTGDIVQIETGGVQDMMIEIEDVVDQEDLQGIGRKKLVICS